MKKLILTSLFLSSTSWAAGSSGLRFEENEERVQIEVPLTKVSGELAEFSIRSTGDFIQFEIPDLKMIDTTEVIPVASKLIKSVLVAPNKKGTRIKITHQPEAKGTVDSGLIQFAADARTLAITIDREAFVKRLMTAESVRHVWPSQGQETIKSEVLNSERESVQAQSEEGVAESTQAAPLESKKENLAVKAESEIKIAEVSETAKPNSNAGSQRIFLSIGVVAVMLLGGIAFLFKYTKKKSILSQAPKMRVINQFHLGPKKQLLVVQVAGESMLLGVTDHNINYIKTLSLLDEELPTTVPENFGKALKNADLADTSRDETGDEDFAFQGLNDIRDRVTTKLKQMRTL